MTVEGEHEFHYSGTNMKSRVEGRLVWEWRYVKLCVVTQATN